jgi:hypothetical protein
VKALGTVFVAVVLLTALIGCGQSAADKARAQREKNAHMQAVAHQAVTEARLVVVRACAELWNRDLGAPLIERATLRNLMTAEMQAGQPPIIGADVRFLTDASDGQRHCFVLFAQYQAGGTQSPIIAYRRQHAGATPDPTGSGGYLPAHAPYTFVPSVDRVACGVRYSDATIRCAALK